LLCRVLCISQSAYHDYQSGKSYQVSDSKAALGERVKAVFYRHRRRYGSRRIMAEIRAESVSVVSEDINLLIDTLPRGVIHSL
jgi:hypothetical protein